MLQLKSVFCVVHRTDLVLLGTPVPAFHRHLKALSSTSGGTVSLVVFLLTPQQVCFLVLFSWCCIHLLVRVAGLVEPATIHAAAVPRQVTMLESC